MRRRICLSAPGVICCAGNDGPRLYRAAREGSREGFVFLALSGERSFPVGRIPDEALAPQGEAGDTRLFRIIDAALEQIRPAVEKVLAAYGPGRIGVCAGSCDNGSEKSLRAHYAYFSGGAFPDDYELRFQGAAYPVEFISRKFGLSGPSLTVSTACASSAGALIKGAELIRAGFCDAVIAGGADIASETVLRGFASLEAVSETLCNPFSKNRRGITLGDGAAFFVMTAGADETGIELLGAGESADAFHMTAPRSDGAGAIRAMTEALLDAGIGPEEVGYVNLHGTGTALNDRMEARAVAAVFPGYARAPLCSSTKPLTGHTLGAAGALELALCWLTLHNAQEGFAPAPIHCWDGVYDEELPVLRFARSGEGVKDMRICMSNSFAFGGCNTSLILGKKDPSYDG